MAIEFQFISLKVLPLSSMSYHLPQHSLGGKLSQWRLQRHLLYFFIFLFLYLRNGYVQSTKSSLSVYLALHKSASVQVDIICTSVIVLCKALKRKDFCGLGSLLFAYIRVLIHYILHNFSAILCKVDMYFNIYSDYLK